MCYIWSLVTPKKCKKNLGWENFLWPLEVGISKKVVFTLSNGFQPPHLYIDM